MRRVKLRKTSEDQIVTEIIKWREEDGVNNK